MHGRLHGVIACGSPQPQHARPVHDHLLHEAPSRSHPDDGGMQGWVRARGQWALRPGLAGVAPWCSTQFTMAALAASFSRLSVAQPSQSLSFSASMRASPITGASTETLKPHGPLPRPDLPLALQRPMHGLGRRPWRRRGACRDR